MTNTAPQHTPTSDTTTAGAPTTDGPSDAVELRDALATRLVTDGVVRDEAVEAAFARVPRHLFLPGLPLADAYADAPVYTKHDGAGTRISAASQPRIVAMMLEQLQIRPGQRILELGAGTGYNAALMAAATGPSGHVTTLDIDADLVTGAREHLAAAGVGNVEVLCADGALGHSDIAPYDRVIATVGAFEIPRPWLTQLSPGGRLVAPVRLAGAASRSIAFERDTDSWTSRGSEMAVFMPLRGIGDDARRVLDLTGTGEVTLQTHKDNAHHTDPATLAGVLDTTSADTWTGVHFGSGESFEWLDLWLSCHLPNPLMRMEVAATARGRGLARPIFPTAAMATSTADGALAYLTTRPAEPSPDGARRFEVGVVGHGTHGPDLAEQVATAITTWNDTGRNRTVHFSIPDTPPSPATSADRVVLDRPSSPIIITWE